MRTLGMMYARDEQFPDTLDMNVQKIQVLIQQYKHTINFYKIDIFPNLRYLTSFTLYFLFGCK